MKIHVKTRLLYVSFKCIPRLTIQDFITYRTAVSSSGGTTGTKTRLVKKVTLLINHCLKFDLEVAIPHVPPPPTSIPKKQDQNLFDKKLYKCREWFKYACRQLEAKR